MFLRIIFILLPLGLIMTAFAQDGFQQTHGEHGSNLLLVWFGILEFPFLFLCIFFAFKTANALKGGVFGKGMNLMAWGFLIMAIGHLHMQIGHFTKVHIFHLLLGNSLGNMAWIIALTLTWTLSGLGFYNIYKASKGKQ